MASHLTWKSWIWDIPDEILRPEPREDTMEPRLVRLLCSMEKDERGEVLYKNKADTQATRKARHGQNVCTTIRYAVGSKSACHRLPQ
jgi:hypothetical protein